MGPADSKSKLSQSIAEILGTAEPIGNCTLRPGTLRPGPIRQSLIYSSMALLAINPVAVNAVGLGALTVNSHLGQPLDVTVPVTLAAGETMPKDCVAPSRGNSGIGTPKNLQVNGPAANQPGTYNLRVTTTNALHEPMYEISLLIDCPGTSLLLRQYVLMLDLPGMGTAAPVTGNVDVTGNIDTTNRTNTTGDILAVPVATGQTSSQAVTPATTSATSQRTARSLQPTAASIPAGKAYRVSKGDTLSTIAARIDGRSPDTTWSVARLIFSKNSHAFIRNNPDLIKLGSLISIPDVAELAGLEKGRTSVLSVAAGDLATTRPESVNDPAPAPEPAPVPKVVTQARPETQVTEPDPQPSASMRASGTPDADISVTAAPVAELPAETSSTIASSSIASDTAFVSPFLDELPKPAGENENGLADTGSVVTAVAETTAMAAAPSDPTPAVTATATDDSSGTVSSLFAILFGMLLGALLSLAAFRRQLIDGVRDWIDLLLSARKKRVQIPTSPVSSDHDDIADYANAFETSEAASAFSTQQQEETEALPVGTPAENTYIVEASEVASTEQIEPPAIEPAIIDPGALNAPAESPPNPDDEMLAMLFNDHEQTCNEQNSEIFDPTGGVETDMAGAFSEPTVEMPEFDDEQDLDPTMLGLTGEFDDESPLEQSDAQLEETAQIPEANTLEEGLDELRSDGENEDLAQKLQEALTLLEGDFDEEFTASQLLERSEVARSIEEPDTEIATDLESLEDKIDS